MRQWNHRNRSNSDAQLDALLQVVENQEISAGLGKALDPYGMPSTSGSVGRCTA